MVPLSLLVLSFVICSHGSASSNTSASVSSESSIYDSSSLELSFIASSESNTLTIAFTVEAETSSLGTSATSSVYSASSTSTSSVPSSASSSNPSSTQIITSSSIYDLSSSFLTSTWSYESHSCGPNCTITAKKPTTWYWYPYSFTESIIAATLIVIVNTIYNTTTTSLKLAELPSGYTLPPTNADGTHVSMVTYPRSGNVETTAVAFPTEFVWWDDGYTWSGTLETSLPGQTGSSCMTATDYTVMPHPSYPQPAVSMPTHEVGPDPQGLFFKPTIHVGVVSDYKMTGYLDVSAWQQCSMELPVFPMLPAFTARFMTETVTSYDDTKHEETASARPEDKPNVKAASETPMLNAEPSGEPDFEPFAAASDDQPGQTPEPPKVSGNPQSPGTSEVARPGGGSEMDKPVATGGQQPAATAHPNQTPNQNEVQTATQQQPGAMGSPNQSQRPNGVQSAAQRQLIPVGSETLKLSSDATSTAIILPNGQTLRPGETHTVDGTPVHIPTSGSAIVIGNATVTFHPTPAPPAITIGTDEIPISFAAVSTDGIVLPNGATLNPGSETTIDGTVFSLGPSGTNIIVDGSTIPINLATDSFIIVGTEKIPISQVIEAEERGIMLPNGAILLPGSSTTIDGTVISLAPSGTALIIDGTTMPLSNPVEATGFIYATAANGGVILPNGETLLPGSGTTIDGTTFSIDPLGTLTVEDDSTTKTVGPSTSEIGLSGSARKTGTSTERITSGGVTSGLWSAKGTIASQTSSTTKGAGQFIWQGLGGGKPGEKGGASGRSLALHILVAFGGLVAGMVIIL